MAKRRAALRWIALTRYGGAPRTVVYASELGMTYEAAEAAALEALRAIIAYELLTLEDLEAMTAALEVLPERRAAARYRRAMGAFYALEREVQAALAEEAEEAAAVVVDADPVTDQTAEG